MKAYVITAGAVFALLALAHPWRIIWEKPKLARDPLFIAITALAAGPRCGREWSYGVRRERTDNSLAPFATARAGSPSRRSRRG